MSTTTTQNQAAWLDQVNTPLRVGDAEMPVPNPDEVLIKVHAIAINPVDVMRQSMGFANTAYPWIFGCDLAGVVESIGSNVSKFKEGDRVLAMASEWSTHKTTNSAYQAYMSTPQTSVCKIPPSISFTDASTIPLGLSTAAGMAFESVTLSLRYPQASSSPSTSSSAAGNEVVIVWGASSSVGTNALQMIRAANYNVIAVASARNHEYLKSLGASACFNYSDKDVLESIAAFVRGKGWTSAGILAAAGFLPPGPVAEVTRKQVGELALKLGGKMFVSTPLARGPMEVPEMPEGVGASNVMAISEEPLRAAIWGEWLEGALSSGQLVPSPPAEVVPEEGLAGIDVALAVARKGYSGKKIVCKIC